MVHSIFVVLLCWLCVDMCTLFREKNVLMCYGNALLGGEENDRNNRDVPSFDLDVDLDAESRISFFGMSGKRRFGVGNPIWIYSLAFNIKLPPQV